MSVQVQWLESLGFASLWRALPIVFLLGSAWFFGRTLRRGQVPLIERIARVGDPELTEPMRRYTRRLTAIWSAYFVVATVIYIVAGAPVAGTGVWVWVGAVSLFVGEHWLRPRWFPGRTFPGLAQQLRDTLSVWRPSRAAPPNPMHPLQGTALAAAEPHLDRIAVIGAASWSWRQIHAASLDLAEKLDPGSTVCNLCVSRVGFLVVWLAAARRGCVQLLPPSGGNTDLVEILKSGAQPVIVVDDAASLQPQWAEHAPCMVYTPDLAMAEVARGSLSWQPDWDAPLICLYTSGSTGRPEPQHKTLGQLARGAQVLAARLDKDVPGGLAAIARIVCSVPPQHMFGVETSVMLPLVTGLPVLEGRPLLPADVRAAFDSDEAGAAWIATPLHLRALAQADESLPHCRLVIASTMPLAPALAVQCEALTSAPVLEIYGSTETGVVAMRRTAVQASWYPVDGVNIVSTAEGSVVRGAHFPSPRALADEVEVDADGRFRLLGRHGDLIKIAGRRASLAGLNLLLQDLPGLVDGVFYLPATGSDTERLVLIHAGPPLDKAATQRWLRERMDPVFLPRTLIQVDRLPRNEVGKLPRAALDEIYRARPVRPVKGRGA